MMHKHRGPARNPLVPSAMVLALAAAGQSAIGAELANNDSVTIRWDNSVKYTLGARTASPSSFYLDNPNSNDGH